MPDKSCLLIMELVELKNENYELEKENVHLNKVISDFLNEKSVKASIGIIANIKKQISQLEGNNMQMQRKNDTLTKELSSLRAHLKAGNASLETFELNKTQNLAEISKQSEKIRLLEEEIKDL